jgi:hypothetical protein
VAARLPVPMAFHGHEALGQGAILCGGFTNPLSTLATTAVTLYHDGATVAALADIGVDGPAGTAVPRGGHSFTRLYDGTFLVYGGGVWPNTIGDGWVYTP